MSTNTELRAFQLKGSLLTLTVLQLQKTELSAIQSQLLSLVKQTPDLFQRMPIIIDLNRLPAEAAVIDFAALNQTLRDQGLVPVGVRGGSPELLTAARTAGLAVLTNTKGEKVNATQGNVTASASETKPPSRAAGKLVTQPVRSGQQIYARGGDLIVLNAVSPGAEILADGNIHVYGTLRGRALAGVSGDKNARIFCQKLDAELVSIAGHYWINEDLTPLRLGQSVQVYLEDDRLHIGTF